MTRLREVEGPSGWHVEDQLEYLDAPEWMRECAPVLSKVNINVG
eukprot:COSAG01_NODE_431_length_17124_cov_26.577386_12_plen_44_part_00